LLALGADGLLRHAYSRLRPRLETDLGHILGRPLELGPYRGLNLSGLQIGPSRLRPGLRDQSSLTMRGLSVGLDPLASLRHRLPVLHVGLRGVEADLRRNAQGQYWVLGATDPDAPLPRLDLRLRLADPARLRLHPARVAWRLSGRMGLQPHRRSLSVEAALRPLGRRDAAGSLLQGRLEGRWDQERWTAELAARRLPLEPLGRLLDLSGELRGRSDGRVRLAFGGSRPQCHGSLRTSDLGWSPAGGAASGQPRLQLPGLRLVCEADRLELPSSPWRWDREAGTVAVRSRFGAAGLRLDAIELHQGSSWLRLAGSLQPAPSLAGRWQVDPTTLRRLVAVPAELAGTRLSGDLKLAGSWSRPRLEVNAAQATNPLLGPWSAALAWAEQRLRLESFSAPHLRAQGSLPLRFGSGSGLTAGDLDLQVSLERFPLQRLDPVLGTQLRGWLDADGTVRGPLSALTPEFRLTVDQPSAGPIGLSERWQGNWFGAGEGGGRLVMEALAPAPVGTLLMQLDRRWVPVAARLERAGGQLSLSGTPRLYRWQAEGLPLDGLQLALGSSGRRQPLQGRLSGAGSLGLQPLAFQGRAEIDRPIALGVWGRRARFEGRYADRRYQFTGVLEPMGQGELDLAWSGRWQGPFRASIQARRLGDDALRQLVQAWPRWRGDEPPPQGSASDLGLLWINRFGASIDAKLEALRAAHQQLAGARAVQQQRRTPLERLSTVDALIDGELTLSGPRLSQASLDLEARAQLWHPGTDRAEPIGAGPVVLRFNGPLQAGSGTLELDGLSLALLGLLTPVPQELRGSLHARGRYRLRAGATPELALSLELVDGQVAETAINLERGQLELIDGRLRLDVALRAAGASSSVDLAGVVPIDPAIEGVELRLSSRDDGLRFLSGLAQPALNWEKGSGDLQLLVRGSLDRPIANGFLRFQEAELQFIGQQVRALDAIVLFDFEELLLQELTARVGELGRVSGQGRLRLFTPQHGETGGDQALQIRLEEVPFNMPRIRAVTDGQLQVRGTMLALDIGGELSIARGTVNVMPGQLEAGAGGGSAGSVPQLIESRWDFAEPVVLVGPEVESDASGTLRAAMPRIREVGFDDLRLSLGPDLIVGVPNLASFRTSGLLRINGRLDPSLRAQGVVRLLRGRLNLFTTSFSLDPDAPNVAVFTPSMGLIPYLDIALRTRVSDSLNVGSTTGSDSRSLASIEEVESNSLNQLNLVRVYLSASGPADRLAQNLRLRSNPPLPEDRLLALIGGNSLLGLSSGAAGTALATVLGQSLLSPLLGSLSDAFGERLTFALYPAYVNQEVSKRSERRSGRVPPQLVLGAEIGLDVSERFNASVLAAPNRSDVPPQLNLTVKASERLSVQGSIDSEGSWQTQLQVFFRF
jgi:translocation and assembly module TamB